MSSALRITLVLTLTLATGLLCAQETATTSTTATATETAATATTTDPEAAETATAEKAATAAEPNPNAGYETRAQLRRLLERYSDELATVLALEPSLLGNEQFVKGHPELAVLLAAHPEIAQHPDFYLADIAPMRRRQSAVEEIIEALAIFATFAAIALALAWFVRTIIEQKRWNRLSRQQSEVHNKILDRFGKTEELLDYIKTPAGAKFLESAPIPLHAERPPMRPALPRGLWSIQAGVVIAAGALGMMLVSLRYNGESAADLFSLGAIGFCIGAGFILSSVVSLFVSRRLGAWQPPAPEDSGIVR
jgi:hypothetical protein